jgi:excisionase family DNA binding protein
MAKVKVDRFTEEKSPAENTQSCAEWFDLRGAAMHVNKPERFIRRLVMERRIRYYKHGRYLAFRKSDLDSWALSDCREPIQ